MGLFLVRAEGDRTPDSIETLTTTDEIENSKANTSIRCVQASISRHHFLGFRAEEFTVSELN